MPAALFSLIRHTSGKIADLKPNTVILIGNGAVENGWTPLAAAMRRAFPTDLSSEALQRITARPEHLGHHLAVASYRYRLFRDVVVSRPIHGTDVPQEVKDNLQRFRKLRDAIAEEYAKSTEIKLRPLPRPVVEALKQPNAAVITTNWDTLLWQRENEFKNLVQLHGICTQKDSLILPTEFSRDEKIFTDLYNKSLSQWGTAESRASLSEAWSEHGRGFAGGTLAAAHRCALDWLENAREVIAWGIACHTYDAELNLLLSDTNAVSNPFERLIVVNPDTTAAKSIAAMMRLSQESEVHTYTVE